jgi:bacillithiol system protein YtxJ
MAEIHSIETKEDIKKALSAPYAVILKHSPRCGQSIRILRIFREFGEKFDGEDMLFTLDVVKHPDLAREIEERTGIRHESPQAIIVKQGMVIWNASHNKINEDTLIQATTR